MASVKCTTLQNGTREFRLGAQLHRGGDRPAIEWADGAREWWKRGLRHRAGDLPAFVGAGMQSWWKRGQRHRALGQPALVMNDGSCEWWVRNKRHRDGGQPAVVRSTGLQEWHTHGQFQRMRLVTDFYSGGNRHAFVIAVVALACEQAEVAVQSAPAPSPCLRVILADALRITIAGFEPRCRVASEYALLIALYL